MPITVSERNARATFQYWTRKNNINIAQLLEIYIVLMIHF